jgi:hypothetical protein
VDVQKYSARNTRRQFGIQRDLKRILDEAASAVGLDRTLWARHPAGDGEMDVLPHGVDLIAVVRRFVTRVDELLEDFNEDHQAESRIRLRIAMHIDVVIPSDLGFAGPALVVLSRLLDSDAVKAALAAEPGANLALILSDAVHRKAVLSELGGLRPAQFEATLIDIPAKGFRETAHIHVPGRPRADSSARPVPARPAPAPPSSSPGGSAVHLTSTATHITGDVVGGGKYNIYGGET